MRPTETGARKDGTGRHTSTRARVLASPAAVGPFCVLPAHLLAPEFAHTLIYWLLWKRFSMTLSWGIDESPTDPRSGGCSLFRRCIARYRALVAIQPVQIGLQVFARHIVFEDLFGANFSLTVIGVFDAGHGTRLEVLAFLHKLFHAL